MAWKKTLYLRAVACWIAAAGMWGILYPEMYFNKDVCRTVEERGRKDVSLIPMEENGMEVFIPGLETGEEIKGDANKEEKEILPDGDIMNADRDEIRIKFKLWEGLKKLKSRP